MIWTAEEIRTRWRDFAFGIGYLSFVPKPGGDEEMIFCNAEVSFDRCHVDRHYFRHLFHNRGYEERLEGVSGFYVRKLMGHKVPDSSFSSSPLVCVLVAREILGGRWREMEDVILGHTLASYFYARFVIGGRLPWDLHGRLGLRTFDGVDYALRRYFSEFAQD